MSLNENEIIIEEIDEDIQFNKIPIIALRQKARQILSQSLNQTKIIPSNNGFPRDWRGIADLAGLRSLYGQTIQMHTDQMEKLLQIWCSKNNEQTASIDNLLKFLVEIDRWDVLSDINEILVEDAKLYKVNIKNIEKNKANTDSNTDENILTVDDVYNAQQSLPPQYYDAFVLFDECDEDFAAELIKRMEEQGFKLCFKERDLIGGVSFEHEAVMRLISERCNRLIVIYSPEFLKSPTNTYLVNYAQSLGIEKGQRKILPCLYKYCNLPTTLSCMWHLDYNRSSKFVNFWDKLRDSILQTSVNKQPRMRLQITSNSEINSNIPSNSQTELKSTKLHSGQSINTNLNINDELDSFVKSDLSEISEKVVDIKGYTPLISETNNNPKKTTKKWINLKKWFPKKMKSSKAKNNDSYNEQEKSKRKFKRQKLVST